MTLDLYPIQVLERDGEIWVNMNELIEFFRVCARECEDNPLLLELADRLQPLSESNAGG